MGSIYVITNNVDGKQYVGKTMQPIAHRWRAHVLGSRKGRSAIDAAIKKYGADTFTVDVVEESDDEEYLLIAERIVIAELDTVAPKGYNLTEGGEGTSGYKLTEEQCKKLGGSKLGNQYSLGYRHTEEAKKAIGDALRNKPKSGEHRRKLRDSQGLTQDVVDLVVHEYRSGLSYTAIVAKYGISLSRVKKCVQKYGKDTT